MLHHIVAIRVFAERQNRANQFVQQWPFLLLLAMLQQALDDATTVRMRTKMVHFAFERVDDKRDMNRWHFGNHLLNHMIAILVAHTILHMILQLAHQRNLERLMHVLKRFLNHATTIHGLCQRQDTTHDNLRQFDTMRIRTVLKEFLNHIIAKHVLAQRQCVPFNLTKDALLVLQRRRLQTLLNKAGTVLIACQLLHHSSLNQLRQTNIAACQLSRIHTGNLTNRRRIR
mmetsp:Transcript_21202/g.34061  ORF Transcript_21202/g.34061 Transcript_21202/m.34061 type:complete len:229 (-) Transcript_21202:99-785(-)